MNKYLLVALLLVWSNHALSDDIELYVKSTDNGSQRPNVLIILDTSPSMSNVSVANSKAARAREIIIDLINDNPSVDFALQLFNYNDDNRHGGRIVYGFNDLSVPSNRANLLNILDNDTNNTNTNTNKFISNGTPLCETLYETYRYLSGGHVLYGNDNATNFEGLRLDNYPTSYTWGTVNVSNRPPSITNSGHYTSPFAGMTCNKEITIIYISDGEPTVDNDADPNIRSLTGASTTDGFDIGGTGNYLGVLGRWMATRNWHPFNAPLKDIDDTPKNDIAGTVKIHTVGFGEVSDSVPAVDLLKLAARDGVIKQQKTGFHDLPAGGKYHRARTSDDLKDVLENVLLEVLTSSSLTSASVSSSGFDGTQTSDSVYYAMFEPSTAARWQGNLKKYKIVNGVQVDALGNAAVNADGQFDKDSKSYWSGAVDGNDVTQGGVAETLRSTATSDRKFFTDVGVTTGALTEDLNLSTIEDNFNPAKRAKLFGINVSEVADIPSYINWAKGVDVDNYDGDNSTLVRPDVFGDPLHSKPVVINYSSGDSRIVIGTNSGVLHMFQDHETSTESSNSITEKWAYLPQEFFTKIKKLRENVVGANSKVYGVDGEITLHINDLNNNGIVDTSETVWLFFGLRRGGSSYYALDITLPDKPKLMWRIDNENIATNDFKELGQTWSKPQVVRSALNKDDTDKLVVIFGGGYDNDKKDEPGANTHNDSKGAAVYMVNARTGGLIFKKSINEMNNGIASSVASLDSNSDGLVDRLYVGDTGGDVWRIDMPDADLSHTSVIKLASLGGITDEDDRRFFNQPAIVRTYITETIETGTKENPHVVKQKIPYDAVLLGSGDRATPLDSNTTDMFFMIKDKYIKTQQFGTASLNSAVTQTPTPTITLSSLYDYTRNPFEGYPTLTAAQEAHLITASSKSGWYISLTQGAEKNTAQAVVANNVVYFTSYTPSTEESCLVEPGDAWLYGVDLALGIKKYNWDTEQDSRESRIKRIGNQFVGKPTIISTPVTDPDTGVTNVVVSFIVDKESVPDVFTFQTMRTSLTIQEN